MPMRSAAASRTVLHALRQALCRLACLLLAVTLAAPAMAAEERKVLVLYSLGSDSASVWQAMVHKGLYDELGKKTWGEPPSIFEERFDAIRVGDKPSLDSMGPYLKTKYAEVKLDAVVTENYLAATFLHSHPELFPGVPRYYVNHGRKNWRPKDGEALEVVPDYVRMLGVITRVAPHTRRVVVVGDRSPRVQEWIAGARDAARPYGKILTVDYWDNQSFDELYRRAALLSGDTAILMFATYGDNTGAKGLPAVVARKLAAVAQVPVFTHVESLVLPGIAGGYVLSGENIGRVIANVLQGQRPDLGAVQRYVFDFPTAERHQLRHIPPGAVLLNRPQGVWELYRWQIILGLTLIVMEGVLITALVMALRSRRRTMTALNDERNNLEDRVLQRTLELLMANNKLEQLATTDPLTGIANRRKMTEQISKELERARRFRHPLSLLMVDIDHFKRINDTYGHDIGDRAIVAVASMLASSMRSIDMVARFGGEEFVLLMPETDIDVAGNAAERLRDAAARLRIEVDGGLKITLTISIGVAATRPQEAPDSPSSLLMRADKALYRAKNEGRDRVVLATA
ncbi:diguanylate cyclase [Pseudoduganella namucuonensis]|uniref:diguanylate cyclase n=1 Tax=Pseudoduganella namucuonensis TaxID=1035707 RepID=A0A1I7JQN0_9BURK|nr:diguanylate cyclase [Pseudoduganella namucuonensis]SFU87487.1 diguanylate cyclase (GGDEF) domain-containing protein [Pseudoduganella namucuonensis]